MRFLLIFSLAMFSACATLPKAPILTQNQIANDRIPFKKPKSTTDLKFGELAEINTFGRLSQVVDAGAYAKVLGGIAGIEVGREAENVNLYDEIADSTWFSNRNARHFYV